MCVRIQGSRDSYSLPVAIKNTPEHPITSCSAVVGGSEIGRDFNDLLGMIVFYRIVGWDWNRISACCESGCLKMGSL
jgi:hypothetical protein